MAVQHSAITDADLHQPKGASTATLYDAMHSNGAGGVTWEKNSPVHMEGLSSSGTNGNFLSSNGDGTWTLESFSHGSVTFVDTATPYVLAATTSFAKAAPTTTASGTPEEITEATTARLTYTGATAKHFFIDCRLSVDHAAGADRDISISIAKNGTAIANTEQIATCSSGFKTMIASIADITLTTNDYIEVFLKISTAGNINVYSFTLVAEGSGRVA